MSFPPVSKPNEKTTNWPHFLPDPQTRMSSFFPPPAPSYRPNAVLGRVRTPVDQSLSPWLPISTRRPGFPLASIARVDPMWDRQEAASKRQQVGESPFSSERPAEDGEGGASAGGREKSLKRPLWTRSQCLQQAAVGAESYLAGC